jgi:hypothetical protein
MAEKGGKRENAGRKSKADEARMRDLVSPYIPESIECVVNIMQTADKDADRLAAAKLLIAYYAGQPPQSVDHTSGGKSISNPSITVLSPQASETIKQMYDERPGV